MTDENPMRSRPQTFQLVWGIALSAVGTMLMFRIPETMQRLQEVVSPSMDMWFTRFSLYLVSIILVGGGVMKIVKHYRYLSDSKDDEADK